MEVCSSTEMGAPGASHLGTEDRGPKTDRSRPRSVPVNALVIDWSGHLRDDPHPEATWNLKKRGMRLRGEPNQFQPKGQH
jgi:hypothetical protein